MDVIINADKKEPPEAGSAIPVVRSFYHQILNSLHYSDHTPPVADLLRQYYGLKGEWIMVSPIHWQATHNDAMIMACGDELQMSYDDAIVLFNVFAEFVAAENMTAYFCDPYNWLLRIDDKPTVSAKPVHFMLHQSMMPQLECLDESLYWQRFITECQMLFSAHSFNASRDECPINGVWLWGQGRLHKATNTRVLCNQPHLLPLAELVSHNVQIYDSTQLIQKNTVLLFDKPTDASKSCNKTTESMVNGEHQDHLNQQIAALKKQLKQKTVHWYWNNIAYCTKPKPWWSRLWS